MDVMGTQVTLTSPVTLEAPIPSEFNQMAMEEVLGGTMLL